MTSEPLPESTAVAAADADKGLLIAVLLIVLLGAGAMLFMI